MLRSGSAGTEVSTGVCTGDGSDASICSVAVGAAIRLIGATGLVSGAGIVKVG